MIGTEVLKYVVDNTKYSGITFCETMKDEEDMIRQIKLVCAKSNKLLRILHHCTTDILVELVLYDSYRTSLYCPFLWTDYTKRTLNKLRVALNNAFHSELNLPTCEAFSLAVWFSDEVAD